MSILCISKVNYRNHLVISDIEELIFMLSDSPVSNTAFLLMFFLHFKNVIETYVLSLVRDR